MISHKTIRMSVLIGVLFIIALDTNADERIQSFTMKMGIIEYNPEASRRYVFKWDGHEEAFDVSLQAVLGSSGKKPPGLPDLRYVGFQTKRGLVCEFGNLSIEQEYENFMKSHPNEEVFALLFEGITGEKLMVKVQSPTAVCRVDLKTPNDDITLWKNLPEKSEVEGEKKGK